MAETLRESGRIPRLGTRAFSIAAITLMYVFVLTPTLIVIPISFDASGVISFPPKEPSLQLYRDLFADPSWRLAAQRSALVALASTTFAVLVGVPAAFLISRRHVRATTPLSGMFLGPLVMPTVIIALGFYIALSQIPTIAPLLALTVAHCALIIPFVFATTTAGLRQIDQTTERAAFLMGANLFEVLTRVVLPQIKYSVVAGALLAFLFSFDEAVIATFVLDTHSETLPVKMFSSIKWEISPLIPAISALLTLLSLAVGCVMIFTGSTGDDA